MKTSLYDLYQFFGGYFHQDWVCEHPDYISVVNNFIKDASSEDIKDVIRDFKILLEMQLSEEELRHIAFYELGCYFDPEPSGITYRQWFTELKTILEESLLGN